MTEGAGESARAAAMRVAAARGEDLGSRERARYRPGRLGAERALTLAEEALTPYGFEPARSTPTCAPAQLPLPPTRRPRTRPRLRNQSLVPHRIRHRPAGSHSPRGARTHRRSMLCPSDRRSSGRARWRNLSLNSRVSRTSKVVPYREALADLPCGWTTTRISSPRLCGRSWDRRVSVRKRYPGARGAVGCAGCVGSRRLGGSVARSVERGDQRGGPTGIREIHEVAGHGGCAALSVACRDEESLHQTRSRSGDRSAGFLLSTRPCGELPSRTCDVRLRE